MIPLRHAATYRVRFDEAGPDGLLRTSGLLRYAQDVGWQHSEASGFDRAWYAQRGIAWVVRAAELEVLRPVRMGTDLEATTEVVGFERIWARRRAECRLPGGELAAWVHTDWVLLDDRGRLARVPKDLVERFPALSIGSPMIRVPLPAPPAGAVVRELEVRPHELDPMNHVNNAVFVDWVEETLGVDGGAATCPRRYRLEYAAAATPGMVIWAAAWRADDRWLVRLTAEDGTVVLRGSVAEGEQKE